MRGPVGTDIEITVRRRGEKKALTFVITRDIIEVSSVKSEIKDEKIIVEVDRIAHEAMEFHIERKIRSRRVMDT
jgi:C-terminal processing protease CtpA/Prc